MILDNNILFFVHFILPKITAQIINVLFFVHIITNVFTKQLKYDQFCFNKNITTIINISSVFLSG